FQKFVGQVVELKQPHYLTGPIIMDATIEQQDGYRFLYTLPLTATSLLIEDTRYSDGPDISEAEYAGEIESYAHAQGWHISELLRTESGILPITLGGDIEAFWDTGPQDVARSGLRAALFHPVTGYSLPQAVRLAETISKLDDFSARSIYDCTRQQSRTLWEQTGFYRALNRMLFLAADPEQRWQILERFYGLNEPLITRFFAGHNTLLDKARILIGKPPVGLSKAYDSVFRYSR
ncbi:MAG: lycopene beta-cyclase CrtY, partial [Gammaproteobacteria bacterium]|nr:lycopene beta-cyclase CrtY [Gammaproteobacteria bacterium]